MDSEKARRISEGRGFIAALDQSGGSTPKALAAYGITPDTYSTEAEMFDLMHQMRARILQAPAFDGERVIGSILFEATMERTVAGMPTPDYLWKTKRIVPFVKVDQGLAQEHDGVQLMKPLTKLGSLLRRANIQGVFGTKMRSVIKSASQSGVSAILDQQFDTALEILRSDLVPILEPEVDIHSPDKADSEQLLEQGIAARLDMVPDGQQVMLKLSLPTHDGLYTKLVHHPKVMRVLALSGGYSRTEASALLARNPGVTASFSRALTEGLTADQSDEEFDTILRDAVAEIAAASD